MECLPGCLKAGESPKYPTVTVEQYVAAMYRKTYDAAKAA